MGPRRVKSGQLIAGIGGAVLFGSMFLDWYGVEDVKNSGFDAFSHPGFFGAAATVFIVAACVVAIGGFVLAATSRSLAIPVAMSAITTFFGGLAMLLVFARMIFQPGPNEFVTLGFWIYIALFAAGAITYGGWIGMRDEAGLASRVALR